MPNQLGLDVFDLEDALFEQKEYMCSADMREFIEENHLDLSFDDCFNRGMLLAAMRTLTMYTIPQEPGSVFAISIPIP